jgi:hypothetical protein
VVTVTMYASHRRVVPQAPYRRSRRSITPPTFAERRKITGALLMVCWLVLIGALTGIALAGALTVVVRVLLGLALPWART